MTIDRSELRRVLAARYPFVVDAEVGPSAVDAGECDRCGRAPRVAPTCGPVAWEALCVGCAAEIGDDGWCDGHAAEAAAMREAMSGWPPEHETVARLWWVATGEVEVDAGAWDGMVGVAGDVGARLPDEVRDRGRRRRAATDARRARR